MSAAASASQGQATHRGLITACVMLATIMQALDTTIANVALPYMQRDDLSERMARVAGESERIRRMGRPVVSGPPLAPAHTRSRAVESWRTRRSWRS